MMVEFAPPQPLNRPVKNGDAVAFGNDSEMFVQFYKNPVTEKDHIKLTFPGDKNSTFDQPVTARDKTRFAQAWNAYVNQLGNFPGQTPIELAAWIDEATQHHLRSVGVFTVEQLAATIDSNLAGLGMGGRTLRDKAVKHVADQKLIARAQEIDKEKEELQQRLDAMAAQLEALTAAQNKPKGKSA